MELILRDKERKCDEIWEARTYFLNQLTAIKNSTSWKHFFELKDLAELFFTGGSIRRRFSFFLLRQSGKVYHLVKPAVFGLIQALNKAVLRVSVAIRKRIHDRNEKRKAVCVLNSRWLNGEPLVSVIIPCYNYGLYIKEALDSVLNQTFQHFEIIVMNDGSTDINTIKVLQEIKHPKVKILHQSNSGLSRTRNNGIKLARGKYICCLDADDMFEPTYLEKCLYRMEKDHLDLCGSWIREFGDSDLIFQTRKQDLESLKEENLQMVASIFTKEIWEKTGGYSVEMNQGYEDWEFWLSVLEAGGRGDIVKEPLFLYRKHGTTMLSKARDHHDLLVGKIKRLHPALFTNNAVKKRAKKSEIRYTVQNPYINLTQVKEKKRILLAIPYMVIGGAEIVLIRIFRSLMVEYDITIVTTQETIKSHGDTSSEFRVITNQIYQLPKFLSDDKEMEDFIYYLLETRDVDLIFMAGNQFIYKMLPGIKLNFPEIKIVDQLYNDFGHIKNNRRYKDLIDLNILENEEISNALLNKYGESQSKIGLIYNGVDVNYFNPEKCLRVLNKENFNIQPGKFVVSFIGRFSEEKAPELFVEIANALATKLAGRLAFIMAGNGPLFQKVERLINRYDLDDQISLPGFTDTRKILSFTDILVLPSLIDGRPNVVLEALSMRVPVVCSEIGGLPGIIQGNKIGYLCKSASVREFTDRIESLISDDKLLTQYKINAREYALKHLDNEIPVKQYSKMIGDLLGRV